MTTHINHSTATIIQFPIGGRVNAANLSRSARLIEEARMTPLHDYGSWYHEDAILESTDSRKPQAWGPEFTLWPVATHEWADVTKVAGEFVLFRLGVSNLDIRGA